jgi:hypothetical protein
MATTLIISQKIIKLHQSTIIAGCVLWNRRSLQNPVLSKEIKWIATVLNNRNRLRISFLASLYTVLCTTEHMTGLGIPIACPLLTHIFRLVLVQKRTQLLHTRRGYVKKYYHNKTETLQWLPGAHIFLRAFRVLQKFRFPIWVHAHFLKIHITVLQLSNSVT